MASTVVVSGEVPGAALGWLDPLVVGVVAAVKGLAIVEGYLSPSDQPPSDPYWAMDDDLSCPIA